jgi:hypothetical protein
MEEEYKLYNFLICATGKENPISYAPGGLSYDYDYDSEPRRIPPDYFEDEYYYPCQNEKDAKFVKSELIRIWAEKKDIKSEQIWVKIHCEYKLVECGNRCGKQYRIACIERTQEEIDDEKNIGWYQI